MDKSLVVADIGADGAHRFRLLETLREYAADKLVASGERARVGKRHANYYLSLATHSDSRADFGDMLAQRRDFSEGLVRPALIVEYDNLQAALRWFADASDWEGCLRLIGALSHDWLAYGYPFDHMAWTELVLRHKDEVSPATRGLALRGIGLIALYRSDHGLALTAFDESLAVYRDVGDGYGGAISLLDRALVFLNKNELVQASQILDEALAESRSAGDQGLILGTLQTQGRIARQTGDLARAESLYTDVLETLNRRGTGPGVRGDAVLRLGEVAEDRGDLAQAREHYERSIELLWQGSYRRTIPYALEASARVASGQARYERAMVLAGAADSIREHLGGLNSLADKSRLDQTLKAAREQLGEATAAAAWEAGKQMALDQAVAFAVTGSS